MPGPLCSVKNRSEKLDTSVESGDNYTVYRHAEQPRLFAVLGAGAEHEPYQTRGFASDGQNGKLFELVELTRQLLEASPTSPPRILLYIHGYNNDSEVVADKTLRYPGKLRWDTAAPEGRESSA